MTSQESMRLLGTLTIRFSEDKRSALVYEFVDNKKLRAVAFNLDSLRPIWEQTLDAEDWKSEENFQQLVFTNRAEAFFIQEENNRIGNEKHRFKVQKADSLGKTSFSLPIKDFAIVDIKFSFDNVNRKLVGAGVLAVKNFNKAQGYFHFSIPPQYKDNDALKIYKEGFEDEFVSTLLGKKTTDNKGLMDIKLQEIVHRRDGGILAVFEQVKVVERRINTTSGRFVDNLRASTDYYHENFFAVSITSDGTTTWKSVFYKKQMSQDDDGKYSSYCLVKTPSTLRFLFNGSPVPRITACQFNFFILFNAANARSTPFCISIRETTANRGVSDSGARPSLSCKRVLLPARFSRVSKS